MVIRKFATLDEFKEYLNKKYDAQNAEKIYNMIDDYNGIITHTFWMQNKENEISFFETRADLCVNKIWKK